ncbi:MAG: protein adenylyltransferase SelO [Rubrimonas sp.]
MTIPFDNSYARLPDRFYARLTPEPPSAPRMIRLNRGLAEAMGLDADALDGPQGARWLSGAETPPGAEPLAMAYAGHQFGGWVPQLGDGRALLLGEVVGPDGLRRDVQLKGSGPTPFSRAGDGRAALGPVLREYLVSEAMAALGIPTTRALAAVATGDPVYRNTPLPGAVLTRVARAHVRVGTFQYFYAREDVDALRRLADYCIDRLYPDLRGADDPPLALLQAVVAAQARLVAQWMAAGFIHGVMNTDNTGIAGETIDYGPCAFMDDYHPATVFSSIDHAGRYAYGAQPRAAHWNLAQLAQAMLPILGEDEAAALPRAQAAVDGFAGLYEAAWTAAFAAKLGLGAPADGDAQLARDLLARMAADGADFTLTFRALADAAAGEDGPFLARFRDRAEAGDWLARWRRRREGVAAGPDAIRAANPAFIPRNHRVEQALAAAHQGDMGPFDRLLAVLARPYEDQPEAADRAAPPREDERVAATFCGT